MSNNKNEQALPASRWRLSLDVWAVTTAFALALLVRIGLVKHIPW